MSPQPKQKPRSSRHGYTLVEVLVAAGMLGALALGWGSFVSQFSRLSKRGRIEYTIAKEHKAVTEMASLLNKRALLLWTCVQLPPLPGETGGGGSANLPRPHPYRWIDPVSGQCQARGNPTDSGNNPAPQFITNTRTLVDSIWRWPTVSGGMRVNGGTFPPPLGAGLATLGGFNLTLDRNFLRNTIIPQAINAGCMTCHDGTGGASGKNSNAGTPPWITPCNLNSTGDWTGVCAGTGQALATRNLLSSRLGQLFLPQPGSAAEGFMDNDYSNLLFNRQARLQTLSYGTDQTRNYIRFQNNSVTTFAGTVNIITKTGGAGCDCIGNNPSPACCNGPGQTAEPGSCTKTCVTFEPGSGRCPCGKDCFQACPETCQGNIYQPTYRCITTAGGGNALVPQVNVTSVSLNPDPTGPGLRVISNAVVPP